MALTITLFGCFGTALVIRYLRVRMLARSVEGRFVAADGLVAFTIDVCGSNYGFGGLARLDWPEGSTLCSVVGWSNYFGEIQMRLTSHDDGGELRFRGQMGLLGSICGNFVGKGQNLAELKLRPVQQTGPI